MNPAPKTLDRPVLLSDCKETRRVGKWLIGIMLLVLLTVLGWMMAAIQSTVNSAATAKEDAEKVIAITAERARDNQQAIRVIEATLPRIEKGVDAIQAEQVANRTLLVKIAAHRDRVE